MRYWWVNQNQTFAAETSGGFLWSPKTRADGGRNQFYDFMLEVAPGDVIFSFCDAKIKAIGKAVGRAETAPKPDFGKAGDVWSHEGWLVPVEFQILQTTPRPKDHIALLSPLLPAKYSPLQSSGNGNQGVYLTAVPDNLAQGLIEILGAEFDAAINHLRSEVANEAETEDDVASITGRTDIGPTTIAQLIKARRGQGIFRANVRLNEKKCRVTAITDPAHLRASHIKPWKDCSDDEKLSGHNGLMLSPHIDHLFDRGFISFSDGGGLLISPHLDPSILASWSIAADHNAGNFSSDQVKFLNHHRSHVFKK